MNTNVEVQSKNNESNANLIRRFTRRVKGSGILKRSRSLRYHTRNQSQNMRKKQTLRHIERLKNVDHMIKLGKLPDRRRREDSVEHAAKEPKE